MNWKQVSISTTDEAADVVSSILIDAGAVGTEIAGGMVPEPVGDEWTGDLAPLQGVKVKAYFGEDGFETTYETIRERLETLRASDADAGDLGIAVDTVPDTDWNENFKKHFTTFRAAGHVVVKPTWEEYKPEPDDLVIEMDPGMAFGSGVHETTRMCLDLLQKYMKPGASVLDVGCGSGILGIAADKLGAGEVLALDYDGVSVRVAQENAQRNNARIGARRSDLLQSADKKTYDVILANIIADIIIRLNEDVRDYIAQDGVYIISGVIADRLNEVLDSLKAHGLVPIETMEMADWRAIAVRRDDAPGIR
jgi:ribosomal protein L11 methyltransferase